MNAIVVWKEPQGTIVPKSADNAVTIAGVAKNLSTRDQKQIVAAFASESFEMMAGFVLNKALSQLKSWPRLSVQRAWIYKWKFCGV